MSARACVVLGHGMASKQWRSRLPTAPLYVVVDGDGQGALRVLRLRFLPWLQYVK
ncbi:hypothetical protein [Nocardia testacea]|uniref:hypothetical protein n=1 Tax=Nocardia testacea TaxID=248551 RepID=UPI003A8410F1